MVRNVNQALSICLPFPESFYSLLGVEPQHAMSYGHFAPPFLLRRVAPGVKPSYTAFNLKRSHEH